MFFAEVILPLSLSKTFTYQISQAEYHFLQPGMRVAVPFGSDKLYTALVMATHQTPPQHYEARQIEYILDQQPIVTPQQITHWQWIASYYMCGLGEVFRSALPAALLLESETIVELNQGFEKSLDLTDDEYLICEALQQQAALKIADITAILNKRSVFPIIRKLIDKKVAIVKEQLTAAYQPKMLRYIQISKQWAHPDALAQLVEQLSKAEKQKSLLLHYFTLAGKGDMVLVKSLLTAAKTTGAVLNTMVDKGIFDVMYLQADRVQFGSKELAPPTLSSAQQLALDQTKAQLEEKDVCLLMGVTASGKTEIYIKLFESYLANGKQVLYLLPEIALTTQLVGRLIRYFGNQVCVYHSKYSNNERVEAWEQVLHGKEQARIIVGARSALFLPFKDLGVIVVDEEHEQTFKQHDPAPRYHARDAAIVLAKQYGAKVLLGSATPAMETYYNASQGKYGMVELTTRYANVDLPEIKLIDLSEKYRKKQMNGHFSDELIQAITQTLAEKSQVILFQNRRGFSRQLTCHTCGHVPHCTFCDVSLTYHMTSNELKCHYCGYGVIKPGRCLACTSQNVHTKGFGTEQVEDELKRLFPAANIARMDQDTTKGKYSFEKIIDKLKSGETQILVGTQMLAKGLDFENVKLVGILHADNLFQQPDFRAYERSFQLMAQVAGRAGRSGTKGKVLIQTYQATHPLLQQVISNNYKQFYLEQIHEREQYKYPPFYRIIRLTLRQKDYDKVRQSALWLYAVLQQQVKSPVLGPEEPLISRIRNEYLRSIMIKVKVGTPLEQTKKTVQRVLDSFYAIPQYRSVKITINVDPA